MNNCAITLLIFKHLSATQILLSTHMLGKLLHEIYLIIAAEGRVMLNLYISCQVAFVMMAETNKCHCHTLLVSAFLHLSLLDR